MSDYEQRRAKNIARNKSLLQELALENARSTLQGSSAVIKKEKSKQPATKKRKIAEISRQLPSRVSARIASVETRPVYSVEKIDHGEADFEGRSGKKGAINKSAKKTMLAVIPTAKTTPKRSAEELAELRGKWTSWKVVQDPPARDENGTFHFPSHPDFQPNKAPSEILREGCFGGSYYRPLYSSVLGITIADDWRELPADWITGINVETQLISSELNPEINKYGVNCGQSIEEWEANGWINHEYDVRGWFQWYTRFFMGRRCDDDERQVGRWKRCVGEKGRWRRTLLKKYVNAGIKSATDDGDDEVEGVSPAIHQTCHHWAWEVRQDVLDRWWAGDTS